MKDTAYIWPGKLNLVHMPTERDPKIALEESAANLLANIPSDSLDAICFVAAEAARYGIEEMNEGTSQLANRIRVAIMQHTSEHRRTIGTPPPSPYTDNLPDFLK